MAVSTPIRVLHVEDNPVDARVTSCRLEGEPGFAFTHVEQLREAFERLDAAAYDVVLLDLMLPDASGLRALQRLCERASELPIVVLSGFGAEDLDVAREAVRSGAQEFLFKGAVDAPAVGRALHLAIERKRLENERIRHAHHDPLTGLGNRFLLESRFARALARAERNGRSVVLLMAELDRMREVVEDHGHDRADLVLKAAAQRLSRQLRRTDTLARLRPHGFVILAEGLREPEDALPLGARMLRVLAEPYAVDGDTLELTGSIGMAPSQGGDELGDLLALAEEALHTAQRTGGNGARFAPTRNPQPILEGPRRGANGLDGTPRFAEDSFEPPPPP